jgi:hypothetical protein
MYIYIGFSKVLTFTQMKNIFEPNFTDLDLDGRSVIEKKYGLDPVQPGEYEIYDREFYHKRGYLFDRDFVSLALPFKAKKILRIFNTTDFVSFNVVFFFKNAKRKPIAAESFEVTDVLDDCDLT